MQNGHHRAPTDYYSVEWIDSGKEYFQGDCPPDKDDLAVFRTFGKLVYVNCGGAPLKRKLDLLSRYVLDGGPYHEWNDRSSIWLRSVNIVTKWNVSPGNIRPKSARPGKIYEVIWSKSDDRAWRCEEETTALAPTLFCAIGRLLDLGGTTAVPTLVITHEEEVGTDDLDSTYRRVIALRTVVSMRPLVPAARRRHVLGRPSGNGHATERR